MTTTAQLRDIRSASGAPSAAADVFRNAMRSLASGVTVIATGSPGDRCGFTATAVCSLTAEPPRLLVCISGTVSSFARFVRAERLSVNVLSTQQQHVASVFSGGFPEIKGESRFSVTSWADNDGVPVLQQACATFACRVAERIGQGSHTIFICDVESAQVSGHADSAPEHALVYSNGRFATLEPLRAS